MALLSKYRGRLACGGDAGRPCIKVSQFGRGVLVPPRNIRILVADDHAVIRKGLCLVLGQEPDFEVVGEAGTGADAYNMCFDLVPDVCLLDWRMPRMDGFEASRLIRRDIAMTRTLIITAASLDDCPLDQLEWTNGLIHKDTTPATLVHAIRTVAAGENYFGPHVSQTLLQRNKEKARAVELPQLSQREQEILMLMATPATYREIANQLILSESTVRTYVKRIFAKLDQPNRTQAVMTALRHGLIELDP